MTSRDEHGVATVWGLALLALLTAVALVAVAVVSVVAGHRRAQAGADLAALAGAGAQRDGDAACRVAGGIAADNGSELTACTIEGAQVRVVVQVRVHGLFGRVHLVRARALAGPDPGFSPS